jgi:hypothetical protein
VDGPIKSGHDSFGGWVFRVSAFVIASDSEAIQSGTFGLDCRVAALLAMTAGEGWPLTLPSPRRGEGSEGRGLRADNKKPGSFDPGFVRIGKKRPHPKNSRGFFYLAARGR